MRRQIFIVVVVVLLLRLPFLNTAAQWDDFNYLAAGHYALTNPAHPSHVEYVFQGEMHSMRGHPHPPGMAWILALCMLVLGPFREIPCHAAFLIFSIVAGLSMLMLARRFVPGGAVEATLLFLAVPASMVSGTSFESDLPLLAFWTLAMALYFEAVDRRDARWLAAAVLAMAAASMVAYTAFLIAPICVMWLLHRRCAWRPAWAVLVTPFVIIGGYQLYERIATGAFPASVLAGHFKTYGFQRLELKLKNAISLTAQIGFVLSPLIWIGLGRRLKWWMGLVAVAGATAIAVAQGDFTPLFVLQVAVGLLTLIWTVSKLRNKDDRFLAAWVLLYFAAALAIFFAGAARYLLPLAAPLALLTARALKDRAGWLRAAALANIALGLGFAWVNAEHWNQARQFAYDAMERARGHRVWVSAEWGLLHYAEALGAKGLLTGTVLEPGDMLITSELSGSIPYATGGNTMETRLSRDVKPSLPVRIVGLGAGVGYATAGWGLKAFDFSSGLVDRLTLVEAVGTEPVLSWLPMNAPEAQFQIVSGASRVEANAWRWAERRSVYRLKTPTGQAFVSADIFIPDVAPGRTVSLLVDGKPVAQQTYGAPGGYTLRSPELVLDGRAATVTLLIDKDFQPAGESRRLGVIVCGIGFVLHPERGAGHR